MLDKFYELMHQIGENPMQAIFLILSVVLLEVILSVDNAAVLATMVKNLPPATQKKALSYGILGAYLFRGIALLFASVIIDIWWLKPIGGAYLMWMAFSYFRGKATEDTSDDLHNEANESTLYRYTVGILGTFWSTVLAVEFMDIVFSIDNIFAAVAMSDNIILIIFGVFIGILAMRFVAQRFVKLMEKYPIMETSAFIVIGLLGIKLFLALVVHYVPSMKWIESEAFDMTISGLTLAIFFLPILWIRLTLGKSPESTDQSMCDSTDDKCNTQNDR
jgi:YkoY family integral membrane protein